MQDWLDVSVASSMRDQTALSFAGMKRRDVSLASRDAKGRGDATGARSGSPCQEGVVLPRTSCVRSFQLSSLQRLSRWRVPSACDLDRAHLRSIRAVRKQDRVTHWLPANSEPGSGWPSGTKPLWKPRSTRSSMTIPLCGRSSPSSPASRMWGPSPPSCARWSFWPTPSLR